MSQATELPREDAPLWRSHNHIDTDTHTQTQTQTQTHVHTYTPNLREIESFADLEFGKHAVVHHRPAMLRLGAQTLP